MTTTMLRHDAPLEVTISAEGKVLRKDVVEARSLDAHITVQSYCFGGAFNGVDFHDGKGNMLPEFVRPTVSYKLMDESYILTDGQLCTCPDCLEEK